MSHTDKPQTRGFEVQNEVLVAILLPLSITDVEPLHHHPRSLTASVSMLIQSGNEATHLFLPRENRVISH